MLRLILRLITLIGGVLAGVLVALGGLYLLTLVWPGLFQPAPTATPVPATLTPRPPATLAPTATLDPLAIETLSPFDRVVGEDASATPAPAGTTTSGGGSGVLPVARLDLQRSFETLGFDFQLARLGDEREHWVAASPDQLALVEITGAEAVELASVTVFGPVLQQEEHGPQRAIYMLTLLDAVLPGWPDGPAWFGDAIVAMARAPGNFETSTTTDGVRVTLMQDTAFGSITLAFQPE